MSAVPYSASPLRAVLDRLEMAIYIGRSLPSVDRDDAAGRLPRAVRIGRSKKWIKSDVDLWLEMGCPDRETFEARKRAAR